MAPMTESRHVIPVVIFNATMKPGSIEGYMGASGFGVGSAIFPMIRLYSSTSHVAQRKTISGLVKISFDVLRSTE